MGNVSFEYLVDSTALQAAWQRFIETAPASWHDAYAMPSYLSLNHWMESGEPGVIFAHWGTGALWYPFVKRALPSIYGQTGYDAISPYGFGGMLLHEPESHKRVNVVEGFSCYWQEFCRQQQIIAEFIRFHPLLENHTLCPFAQAYHVKDVVWFDLTQSETQLWEQLHSQKRRYLKKADASGLMFSDSWDAYADFRGLYAQSMQQKEASVFYHFSEAFFDQLEMLLSKENPHEEVWLHSVCLGKTVLSAALFLVSGETVHYFLGANHPDARQHHSSEWLLWKTALKARQQGFKTYTLGGGLSKDDSLFRFKQQLSPLVKPYYIGVCIHNPTVYEAIKTTWQEIYPQKQLSEDAPLFFYRDVPQGMPALPVAAPPSLTDS